MRRGIRLGGTLIVALAVVSTAATSVHAGTTFGDLELSYIRATQSEMNADQQYGPVIADCNTFTAGFPLSGGNSVAGGVGDVYLNTAYPQPDQGASDPDSLPDGWRVFTDNVGPGPTYGIGATVICSTAEPAPHYPIPQTSPNHQNVRSSAGVLCPAGTNVVGGGALASGFYGEQRVAGSNPTDSQDQNRTPDDGWRVDMDNIGTEDETVTAYAVCLERGGFSYVTKRFEARRNIRAKGKALCPGDTLNVGGGVRGLGPYNSTWIVDHSTSTKFDDGETKNEGWKARMEIRQGPPREFKVFAICHR